MFCTFKSKNETHLGVLKYFRGILVGNSITDLLVFLKLTVGTAWIVLFSFAVGLYHMTK